MRQPSLHQNIASKSPVQQAMRLCYLVDDIGELNASILCQYKAAGLTSIQYRNKDKSYSKQQAEAAHLFELCQTVSLTFFINDHVELAARIRPDGIHLGQEDMSPFDARKRLGSDILIGLSVENREQLEHANDNEHIDYIAASPVFETPSKKDTAKAWGIEGLQFVVSQSYHPVVAIGGINLSTIESVSSVTPDGIAIISAIRDATDPCSVISHFNSCLNDDIHKGL